MEEKSTEKFSGVVEAPEGAGHCTGFGPCSPTHFPGHASSLPGELDRSTLVHEQISSLMREYEGVSVWGEKIPSSLKGKDSKCEALMASIICSQGWFLGATACRGGGDLVEPVLFFIVPLDVTHVSLSFSVSASVWFSLCQWSRSNHGQPWICHCD